MSDSFHLTDSEYKHLSSHLETTATTQMTDKEIGSSFGYGEKEFGAILESYPEFGKKIEMGRNKGQSALRTQLWNKAMRDKDFNELKYLAYEYLSIGQDKKQDSLEALEVSADTLKKIHDLLTH